MFKYRDMMFKYCDMMFKYRDMIFKYGNTIVNFKFMIQIQALEFENIQVQLRNP